MIIGRQEIVFLYQYFYSRKYNSPNYIFKPSERAEKEIASFIGRLDAKYGLQSIGKVFLTTYFNFQFKRVENLTFKRFSSKDKAGKIQIYDIIGRKAFEYWTSRNQDFDYTISTPINWPPSQLELNFNRAEEIEKKRFLDTQRGFLHCIERTSLYNPKSTTCIICTHKYDCRELLKQNYPNIYSNRISS